MGKTIYTIVSSLLPLISLLASFLFLSMALSPNLTAHTSRPIDPQSTALFWWFLMPSQCQITASLPLHGLLWAEENTVPTEGVSTSVTSPTGLCWVLGYRRLSSKGGNWRTIPCPSESPPGRPNGKNDGAVKELSLSNRTPILTPGCPKPMVSDRQILSGAGL